MNRDSIDRFCERGILVLALGILVLGPLCAGAVRTPELAALGLLTAVILGLWIVRLWMQERPKLGPRRDIKRRFHAATLPHGHPFA